MVHHHTTTIPLCSLQMHPSSMEMSILGKTSLVLKLCSQSTITASEHANTINVQAKTDF